MKVLLINGTPMVLDQLKRLLAGRHEVSVVAEPEITPAGLEEVVRMQPDVVVIDLHMPLRHGAAAVRRILELKPELKVIALSMHCDRHYLAECIEAGVSGYLLKDCAWEELPDALQAMAEDRRYLSRAIRPHSPWVLS